MYIIKTIFLYLITSAIPLMMVYLGTGGLFRISILSFMIIAWILVFIYIDKFILLFLGAREIIDADSQLLFQALKSETYRTHENLPSVYLYSGHRVKAFVLSSRDKWSIVLDRTLVKTLSQEQLEALVNYLIRYKKNGQSKVQTLGMGVSSVILKMNYWFWDLFGFKTTSKLYRIGIFLACILIKPLIDIISKLTLNSEKIICQDSLKSIYLQVDQSVLNRSFLEFMIFSLEDNNNFSEIVVEFLEGFPLLENCTFEEFV